MWGSNDMPEGVVRHGICVDIEAETYETAVALLAAGYANGRRPLVVGSAEEWTKGGAETIVSLKMHTMHDPPAAGITPPS